MATSLTIDRLTPQAFIGTRTSVTAGSSTPNVTQNVYQWTDTFHGVRLPNWKKIIREGGNATTSMNATETKIIHVDGLMIRKVRRLSDNKIFEGSESGFIRPDFDPPTGNLSGVATSSASRDASSKFYSKARAAQSHLLTGVVVGELRETLGMISGRGKAFRQLLFAWRNRHKRRRRGPLSEKLKHASDSWLEFQFGWKPLAADVKGALAAWKDDRTETVPVSGSGRADINTSNVGPISTGANPIQYTYSGVMSSTAKVKIRGGVQLRAKGHGRTLQKFGLLPSDFVVTAYELLPWSFLVDYFTDLGNVLGALTFPKQDLAWCSTAQIRELKNSWIINGFRPPGTGLEEVQGSATFIPQVTIWTKRDVVRTKDKPSLPTPTVRFPPSSYQWANILALLISSDFSNLRI